MDEADNGAPIAQQAAQRYLKISFDKPCKYNSGSNCPTSFDRRLKKGMILLSNFSSVLLTRGRHMRIVSIHHAKLLRLPVSVPVTTVPSTDLILSDFSSLKIPRFFLQYLLDIFCTLDRTIVSNASYVCLTACRLNDTFSHVVPPFGNI